MYTIGEFAAFGRVSVRMLRHYDSIGLLAPAYVDPHTGYRRYDDPQLVTLLRIVELRRLGCSLDDAAEVIAAADPDAALRAVLERRRDALSAAIADERAQLAAVESRLHQLEEGETMSTIEVEYRRIEPVTVYAASADRTRDGARRTSDPSSTPCSGRCRPRSRRPASPTRSPASFWYEPVPDSDELRVNVSWVASGTRCPASGYEVVELPGDRARRHLAATGATCPASATPGWRSSRRRPHPASTCSTPRARCTSSRRARSRVADRADHPDGAALSYRGAPHAHLTRRSPAPGSRTGVHAATAGGTLVDRLDGLYSAIGEPSQPSTAVNASS